MTKSRCLYCYQELATEETDFHPRCSRAFFGTPIPPELPYSEGQMLELAEMVIKSQMAVTGVQPKISLGLQKLSGKNRPERFTIVGLWGEYILKPPTLLYPNLPELEDLTMNLGRIAKIPTVKHSLIRLKSRELAYITKRIDRNKSEKSHMEDMCQLTERMTEHKYQGSYEQIGKAIVRFSANPGLDLINFFEMVIFSFLTGNNDMHLKNFSLLKDARQKSYGLCPAYDMVASALVVEGDDEDLALTLNGKKKKIRHKDFETGMQRFGLEKKIIDNMFIRFEKWIPEWHRFIDQSFIPEEMKHRYHSMIDQKASQIEIKHVS